MLYVSTPPGIAVVGHADVETCRRGVGGTTLIVAVAGGTGPLFEAAAVAVSLTVLGVPVAVGLTTCTVLLVLAAIVPNAQLRVCGAVDPRVHPVTDGLMVHFNPVRFGSASLRVTALAAPGPALLTVMVN